MNIESIPLPIQAAAITVLGSLVCVSISCYTTFYITKTMVLGWQKKSWKRNMIMTVRKCFYKLKINLDTIKSSIRRFEKKKTFEKNETIVGEINENLNNLIVKSYECLPWIDENKFMEIVDRFVDEFKQIRDLQKNITEENLEEIKNRVENIEKLLKEEFDVLCAKF